MKQFRLRLTTIMLLVVIAATGEPLKNVIPRLLHKAARVGSGSGPGCCCWIAGSTAWP
jgi:hypothetical protein